MSGYTTEIQELIDEIWYDWDDGYLSSSDIYTQLMSLITNTLSTDLDATMFINDDNFKFCYAPWSK